MTAFISLCLADTFLFVSALQKEKRVLCLASFGSSTTHRLENDLK